MDSDMDQRKATTRSLVTRPRQLTNAEVLLYISFESLGIQWEDGQRIWSTRSWSALILAAPVRRKWSWWCCLDYLGIHAFASNCE